MSPTRQSHRFGFRLSPDPRAIHGT
jgi:hypothetical protein